MATTTTNWAGHIIEGAVVSPATGLVGLLAGIGITVIAAGGATTFSAALSSPFTALFTAALIVLGFGAGVKKSYDEELADNSAPA